MMNTKIIFPFAACIGMAMAFVSCQETDTEAPSVCTEAGAMNSILSEEIEAVAGDHIDIEDLFCDNEALSQVRYDIHNAEGHAHDEGVDGEEEEHGLVLHSGTDWSVLRNVDLEGTEAEAELHVDVPLTARGIWHVVVDVVDAAGNTATYNTDLHVENTYMPEFTLTSVNGEDPSMWHGEPTWAAGSEVVVEGAVTDEDGIASAELALIDEATETVVWSVELAAFDAFSETVTVPASAGEYHFEMKATCNAGVSMETGFHVEVE
jgi:hypothetical protein